MAWAHRWIFLAGVVLSLAPDVEEPSATPSWSWSACGTGSVAAPTAEPGPAVLERVDVAARRAVADGEVPGLAVGLAHRGRLVFSRGYGLADLERGTRVMPDTVFPIFSVTKAFTAAAIMQLVERGRLGLDDPLARFVPDFPRADEVTVRQLLSHSSGIHDYAGSSRELEQTGATPEELVRHIAAQPVVFDFTPGTQWAYSNSGYVLLGVIVERATGQRYGDHLAEHVLAPAGLRRTGIDDGRNAIVDRAFGYVQAPSRHGAFVPGPFLDMSFVYAAGGLLSTVPELAAWFTAFFDGRIVGPATIAAMLAPARLRDGSIAGPRPEPGVPPGEAPFYGLGLRSYCLDGRRAIGPSGSFSSFSSKVTYYPEAELLLVVLTNTGGKAAALEEQLARIVLAGESEAHR